MAVLWMAVRLLRREWRSGELAVLLVSLSVAVAALTGVGFLVDRIARAVYRADPDRAPGPGFGLRGVRTGTAAQRCRSCGHAAGAAGEPHAVRPAAGGLRKSPGPLRRVVHGARASRGAPGAHRRRQPADWRRGAAREPLPVPGQPGGAAAVRRGGGHERARLRGTPPGRGGVDEDPRRRAPLRAGRHPRADADAERAGYDPGLSRRLADAKLAVARTRRAAAHGPASGQRLAGTRRTRRGHRHAGRIRLAHAVAAHARAGIAGAAP